MLLLILFTLILSIVHRIVYVKAKTFYKNIINIPPVGLYILFFIFCYIGIYGNVTH